MEKKRERDDLVQPEVGDYHDPSSDPTAYDSDGDGEWGGDSSKKKKKKFTFVDDIDDEYCDQLDRDLYRFGNQCIDTNNAAKMLYDVNDMLNLRVDPESFAELISVSSHRNCLNVFDAPSDPRLGGFYHISNVYYCNRSDFYVKPAKFALDYYSTHCNPSAKIKFVRIEKVTCWPQGDYFHYITIRARDEVEEVERIYQAIVLQYCEDDDDDDDDDDYYPCKDACFVTSGYLDRMAAAAAAAKNDYAKPAGDTRYILGMLRIKDPDHDHVLGIIQLKPGVNHDNILKVVRKH